jgi:hypothetical protein
MTDEHLHPHRGWALIRDDGELTPAEIKHLERCSQCHSWLAKFTSLARKSGFKITFKIPPRQNRGEKDGQGSEVA